jgi:hypothetical protein
MRKLLLALGACLYSTLVLAIPHGSGAVSTTGSLVIPVVNNVSTNWGNAGLLASGGIPNRTTQCGSTVAITNVVPPATGDDTDAMNAAIAACTAGDYILLAPSATSTAVVSISGNTLTLVSGTLAWGDAILGNGLYPGETVTGGSGSTWTVSFPPVVGATVSNETVTVATQFNVSYTKSILINKGITIRGSGTCAGTHTFQAVCGTIVNVYDGVLPDWAVSPAATSGVCGVTTASFAICNANQGVFLISPTPTYEWGWGGCGINNANPTTSNCGTTITADIAQGATSVQVSSVANFSAGQCCVLIDESPQVSSITDPTTPSNTIEATSDFLSTSASPATMRLTGGDIPGSYSFIGTGGGSQENQRLNQELHKIANVGTACPGGTSLTICFDDPVTLAFRQSGSHDARVYWPTCNSSLCSFVSGASVENLSITRALDGGVQFTFATLSWMKGVDVGGWVGGAVNVNDSSRVQIEHNYFHLGYNLTNNGGEYPIGISERATEVYVDDNIDVFGGKGMVGRASNTAVIAYNYVDQSFYMTNVAGPPGDYFQEFGANASHYAGTHHWLLEGNWTYNCDNDSTHGNSIYNTFFRNDCTALRSNLTDYSVNLTVSDTSGIGYAYSGGMPTATANSLLRAAGPMGWDYWNAWGDNILGTAGQTTTANGWVYQSEGCNLGSPSGQNNKSIWCSGWMGGGSTGSDPNLDGVNTPAFLFKNHNYDYQTGGFADNASGYSQSFPNSLYTSSTPAFWPTGTTCSPYPFPWVTPDSTTKLQVNACSVLALPAYARYANGAPLGPNP